MTWYIKLDCNVEESDKNYKQANLFIFVVLCL
jgi:hypothetical protein